MRKIAAIFTLLIFLISLIPISIAQDLTDAQKEANDLEKDRLKALEDQAKDRLKQAEDRERDKPRAAAIRIKKDELLKERKFADLRKDRLDRFKELKEDELDKFKDLKKRRA